MRVGVLMFVKMIMLVQMFRVESSHYRDMDGDWDRYVVGNTVMEARSEQSTWSQPSNMPPISSNRSKIAPGVRWNPYGPPNVPNSSNSPKAEAPFLSLFSRFLF